MPLNSTVAKPAIKLLANMIVANDNLSEKIECDMLWVLAVCIGEAGFEVLKTSGILPKLINNLLDIRSLLLTPTLKILCSFSTAKGQV